MSDSASAPKLSPRQRQFCAEYIIDLNATQAAIRAGYAEKTANREGSRLLSKVDVQVEIQRLMAARSSRTEITADAVLRRLWAIATADPNELVEHRRTCCRHCHGAGFRYHRTAGEMDRDRRAHARAAERSTTASRRPPQAFDEMGGIGYDPRRDPHPDCPECFGDGVGSTFFHDTRKLSESARLLYAGVKQTREGLEIKMRDQDAALVNIGRHLKLFTDRHDHEHHGDVPITIVRVPSRKADATSPADQGGASERLPGE